MFRDYSSKGVKFFYVYKALAHPEHNGYIKPYSLKERLLHVKEAKRTLGSGIAWICDSMDNDLKHSLGNAPNSEFIIGPDGKVLVKRLWSDPSLLRKDLERLVGKVDQPTTIADLNMKTQPPPKVAARGIVPRLQLPAGLKALKIEPVATDKDQPFYVKLRAEADNGVLRGGKGKLYLGFHLDPIYKVHWNNLTKPIRVTLQPTDGLTVSPTTLNGPKVKQESDIDPREFLIDVDAGAAKTKRLKLSVFYFACNDEAGWCKPVKQEYIVHLEADADGGWRLGGGRGRKAPRRGVNRPNITRGRIISVDTKQQTVTVMTQDRKRVTHSVSASANFGRNSGRAKLSDFRAGDMIMFRVEAGKNGKSVITGMRGRPGRR